MRLSVSEKRLAMRGRMSASSALNTPLFDLVHCVSFVFQSLFSVNAYSIKPMTKERQDQQRGVQANVVILAM
jgi:hypothetical protein